LRDGWYYTGDYGRIDEDGFLHLIGRRQNCIERADGKLVSPEELEVMLRQSPFIKDAVVVGFYDEEAKDYEPAALVVPDLTYTGEAYGIDFTDEELEGAVGEWVSEMNEGLPPHKQITLFDLTDAEAVEEGKTKGQMRMEGMADPVAETRARLKRDAALQEAVNSIRKKYGKDAMLRGMDLEEAATTRERNHQVGGHKE
jgi:long-chain acyl-CoA synthetase